LLKSKEKLIRVLFIPFVLLWCSSLQAEPVQKSEDLSLEVVEKEVSELSSIQVAQGFGGIREIPFSSRKNRPEGDIRIGRFEVHPSAGISYKYNDNIFLEADQSFLNSTFESPTSDSIYTLLGSLGISKELEAGDAWGFNMFYEAQDENFLKTSSEDFLHHKLDTALTLAGQGGRTRVTLFGNFLNTINPSSSEFASNFNPRSERILTELGERFRWALTPRTLLSLDGKIGFERFDASTLQGEDKNILNGSTSVLWAWTTLTSFGMNLIYENTHFTAPQSTNKDSNLYGFLFVAKFNTSSLFSGDLGIGYQERFVSGGSSRGGFTYKSNLMYHFSDRTQFVLVGERGIQDSTFAATSVNVKTNISLAWEQQWPLFPKIGTRLFLGFENLDFDEAQADTVNGGGAFKSRSDNVTTGELNIIYNIQDWLKADMEIKRIEFNSNFDSNDYESNVLTFSVTAVF
jgi:hypothetical protein